MGSDHEGRSRRRDVDEEMEEEGTSPRHPKIDPDERDEYDEWRRERGGRRRKRRDKAGGRHRHHEIDEF